MMEISESHRIYYTTIYTKINHHQVESFKFQATTNFIAKNILNF